MNSEVRVMTLNTSLGENPEEVAKIILKSGAGIVCLQEVTRNYNSLWNTATLIKSEVNRLGGSFWDPVISDMFVSDRHIPYRRVIRGYILGGRRELGNAVLVNKQFIIKSCQNFDLSDSGMYFERSRQVVPRDAEPRPANIVTIMTPEKKKIRVFNIHGGTHEDLEKGENPYRDFQVDNLLELIGDGKRTIVAGDFNFGVNSKYQQRLDSVLRDADTEGKILTWPVRPDALAGHLSRYGKETEGRKEPFLGPTMSLDRIMYGSGIKCLGIESGMDPNVSDHAWVCADLEIMDL